MKAFKEKTFVRCHEICEKNKMKKKQDGRLAPAYFSLNYEYFDQLLQTVKNKTTVLNLIFKEFLQTTIPRLISLLHAKGCHHFPLKNFSPRVPKKFVEEPFCVSEKFWYRNILWIRDGGGEGGSITIFCQKFLSHSTKKIRRGTLLCFRKILVSKHYMDKRRGRGGREYHNFLSKIFLSQCQKNS